MSDGIYYSEYLQLDKILNAQDRESVKDGDPAHDEMLFIIIHQSYELWFKQLWFELDSVVEILDEPINDNSPSLQTVVHRLKRMVTILRVLVQKINIIETITPLDFLDFRDLLRPASGFQSIQFKMFEAKLGLKYEARHGKNYYVSQLKDKDRELVKSVKENESLIFFLNKWLERMPFIMDGKYWENWNSDDNIKDHPFWKNYKTQLEQSLSEREKDVLSRFDRLMFESDSVADRGLSNRANRSALFIMLYRGYPLMHQPFEILQTLLDIDEQLATWRFRHMNMVHRVIGTRVGTGGSTGKDYLAAAVNKHFIFKEIAELTSFLIERKNLPTLPQDLQLKLGYEND